MTTKFRLVFLMALFLALAPLARGVIDDAEIGLDSDIASLTFGG
ncbi:MAG: hypothetical protein ABIR24_13610 [Verrucomicrobiota bacterium]